MERQARDTSKSQGEPAAGSSYPLMPPTSGGSARIPTPPPVVGAGGSFRGASAGADVEAILREKELELGVKDAHLRMLRSRLDMADRDAEEMRRKLDAAPRASPRRAATATPTSPTRPIETRRIIGSRARRRPVARDVSNAAALAASKAEVAGARAGGVQGGPEAEEARRREDDQRARLQRRSGDDETRRRGSSAAAARGAASHGPKRAADDDDGDGTRTSRRHPRRHPRRRRPRGGSDVMNSGPGGGPWCRPMECSPSRRAAHSIHRRATWCCRRSRTPKIGASPVWRSAAAPRRLRRSVVVGGGAASISPNSPGDVRVARRGRRPLPAKGLKPTPGGRGGALLLGDDSERSAHREPLGGSLSARARAGQHRMRRVPPPPPPTPPKRQSNPPRTSSERELAAARERH